MRVLSAIVPAILILTLMVPLSGAGQDRDPWPYLPSDDIGAVDWRAAHPTWDGRGVVIAILDTGVDGYAPGLIETSGGLKKLIETRDFTPEGEWSVVEAALEDGVLVHEDGLRLEGAAAMAVSPGEDDQVWIGVISEAQFKNNDDLEDVNDDGDRDDTFGFIAWAADRDRVESAIGVGQGLEMLSGLNETAAKSVAEERASRKVWLVVVDTDGNGRLDDEALLRDYHVDWNHFALGSNNAPDSRALMAWSVNVRANEDFLGAPEAPTIEFHYDAGSHGSHCAGIAAGYEVSGQAGLHGAAPGAWLISCKLGDNRLSGGATRTESMKKAVEYAIDFGERYGLTVVVNMSFGINSVEEAESSIGDFLSETLAETPNFYFCTSNGNEGPGLSSSGIPSSCPSVISSGAYLSRTSGEDLYNARLPQNTLFAFSSRGGEAAKPDIVTPGGALSSVPGFVDGSARFNGTSMASPQTAGAVACLVSAAEQSGLTVHWGMVKRALIAGGVPIPGLELFDQGGGLLNIANSWKVLEKLARSESAHEILDWTIEAPCPLQADGTAPAAYWRTPGGVPVDPDIVSFRISPIFHPDLRPDEKDVFFRSFNLKSEASWLKLLPTKRYVRGDMAMRVDVAYDEKKLSEPGVYSARVIGSLDGGDLSGLAAREFSLWNTVVVGETPTAAGDYRLVFEGEDVKASTTRRHFVNVPAGATAMRCRLEVSDAIGAKRGSGCYLEINNPEGAVKGGWNGYARPDGRPITDSVITPPELYPGIWEMNIVAAIGNLVDTDYRLSVSFDAYDVDPPVVSDLAFPEAGQPASTGLTVTRAFPGVFKGDVSAVIDAFTGEREVTIEETDIWTHGFTLDGITPRAEFHLEMDEATANLFTDCAVNILDASGHVVVGTGFGGLVADVSIAKPKTAETAAYTLKVVGGFALKEEMAEWGFTLTERYKLASPVEGEVSSDAGRGIRLYCGVPAELNLSFDTAWPEAPEGLAPSGHIRFRDTNLKDTRPGDRGGRLVLDVPIEL